MTEDNLTIRFFRGESEIGEATVIDGQTILEAAEDAGVSRESLYRALSANGNPEFGTVLKVLASLNIKLIAQPDGVGSHHTGA